jgi:hypothetical protein
VETKGRFDIDSRLERCRRPGPHRPPPVADEAMQRMRMRFGGVRFEPMRRLVVLDNRGHAAVIVARDVVRQHERPAERRERDEEQRPEKSAPSPKPGQHSRSRVASGIEECQGDGSRHAMFMSKEPASVTLGRANLVWLRGRAARTKRRSLSDTLDAIVTAARLGGHATGAIRSVVSTATLRTMTRRLGRGRSVCPRAVRRVLRETADASRGPAAGPHAEVRAWLSPLPSPIRTRSSSTPPAGQDSARKPAPTSRRQSSATRSSTSRSR